MLIKREKTRPSVNEEEKRPHLELINTRCGLMLIEKKRTDLILIKRKNTRVSVNKEGKDKT